MWAFKVQEATIQEERAKLTHHEPDHYPPKVNTNPVPVTLAAHGTKPVVQKKKPLYTQTIFFGQNYILKSI